MPCSNLRALTHIAVRLGCGLALITASAAAYAKMVNVTLLEFVKKSDVIVYGPVNQAPIGKSHGSPPLGNFEAQLDLKCHAVGSVRIVSLTATAA